MENSKQHHQVADSTCAPNNTNGASGTAQGGPKKGRRHLETSQDAIEFLLQLAVDVTEGDIDSKRATAGMKAVMGALEVKKTEIQYCHAMGLAGGTVMQLLPTKKLEKKDE